MPGKAIYPENVREHFSSIDKKTTINTLVKAWDILLCGVEFITLFFYFYGFGEMIDDE